VGNASERGRLLVRGLRLYNPLQIGALGLLVFSGALRVTELKDAYRESFLAALGWRLGLKLVFSFALIVIGTYHAMGVAHRFVRRAEGGDPLTLAEIERVTRRLQGSALFVLAMALATVWLGLYLRT
jgi:hypothetical protein